MKAKHRAPATASSRVLPPPSPPAAPWGTTAQPSSLSLSSSSSSASASPLFTLHVNSGEAHCLKGWQRRPSPKWWAGSGPIKKKKSFPIDQNTRWRLPVHILLIRDKNSLSLHICQVDTISLRVDDRRDAAYVRHVL